MDIESIKQNIYDITVEMDSYTNRDMVKTAINDLNAMLRFIEELDSNDEIDDEDYQEIVEEINETKHLVKESFDLRMINMYTTDGDETPDSYFIDDYDDYEDNRDEDSDFDENGDAYDPEFSDLDDDLDDDEDEDDEEDYKPKKGYRSTYRDDDDYYKPKKSRSKSRSRYDDDDEDDDY